MKKIFRIILIALLLGGSIVTENQVKAQTVSVSLSVFQRSLSPYGRWVNHSRYGQVWIANVNNFTPYETGGHWAYTDYGWTWVSDYDWGWAPFHYGRWNWEPSLGWYWVPDYDWGPAWVAWRNGGDYYGWAPLAPGLNVSIGVSYGNRIPSGRWVFAPRRYITSPYINRYYVPRTRNVTIIKNTTIVNNITVKNNVHIDAGPRRDEVERFTHTRVKTYKVANSSRPGKTVVNNNTVNVYRPVVNKTTVNNNKTVVNKNSNNKTVNKNSNNTTIDKSKTTVNNKKENNTTVNNKKTVEKKKATTVNNKAADNSKHTTVNNKKPQPKKAAVNKKVDSNNKQTTLKKEQQQKKPVVKSQKQNKQQVKKQKPDQHQVKKNASDSNKNGKRK